jgi:hypothetical protein
VGAINKYDLVCHFPFDKLKCFVIFAFIDFDIQAYDARIHQSHESTLRPQPGQNRQTAPLKEGACVNYRLGDGARNPYVAALLGNLRHWLNDDTDVTDLVARLPEINRKTISDKYFFWDL